MSTEVKNTLYRFITMRASEVVEEDEVIKSFVLHPENGLETPTSEFLSGINSIPEGKTKKQYLIELADNFSSSAINSKASLKLLIDEELYDFAIWLTKNRTTLKENELNDKLDSYATLKNQSVFLDSTLKITLWDNLFYQIITFKSGYVRDVIISVLVAEFFLKNYQEFLETNGNIQHLAQARVIIPKNLFSISVSEADTTAKKDFLLKNSMVGNETKKAIEINLIQEQLKLLNSLNSQINALEIKYDQENEQNLLAYNKKYETAVETAYANATKVETTTIDPNTEKEFTIFIYENLSLPTYDFEPTNVIEYLLNNIKDNSLLKIIIENFEFKNFNELYDFLKKEISILNQFLFDRTTVSQKVLTTGGVSFTQNKGSNSLGNNFNTFTLSSSYSLTNKLLIFSFSGMELGTSIQSGSYSITLSDNSIFNGNFTGNNQMINDTLIINIPISNAQSLLQDGDFTINGTFFSSESRELNFSGLGKITILTSPTSNPSSGGSSGFNTMVNISHELNAALMRTVGSNENYTITGSGYYEYQDPITISDDTVIHDNPSSNPTTQSSIDYVPSGYGIKRIGIADYRKVEQEVCCYVPGEVSHIENVMAREYKEKATRFLRSREETNSTSKETETEKLTDTTSTSRFEMNQEIASVLAEQNSFAAGAQISWKGLVSGSAFANFANNTSSENSNIQAVTNAQEVTERALERVVQKVKEERVIKILEEFEETNKHGFDNRKGDKHISGVFRWVDKIMKNQVINYGKRLMYEFMIPEPASFHNVALQEKISNNNDEVLLKPVDPRSEGLFQLKIDDNFDTRYIHWAEIFNVEVELMPKEIISIGKSFSFSDKENTDGKRMWNDKEDLIVPEGYITKKAFVEANHIRMISSWGSHFTVSVGNQKTEYFGNSNQNSLFPTSREIIFDNLNPFKEKIPISMASIAVYIGAINVNITCNLTSEAKKKWQMETFNAIIEAYEAKLSDYNDKISALKATQTAKAKTNPMFYRQIENSVLRKNCIEYLISKDAIGKNLLSGTTTQTLGVMYDSPELESYANKVKFIEQAFEWDIMSYYFYPFYWANKNKWKDMYNVDEMDDSVFRAFLQSGMARVILTVRPGFEEAVNWYMATGQIWNGGQVPTVDDELFISIVKELRETTGVVEETWESRVPTSLTVIQAGSIGLNVEGLPCNEECEDNLKFDSDGQPVLDENGNQVNIIGQNSDAVQLGNITNDLVDVTDSIEEIKTDIEEIKTTLQGMAGN